MDEILFIAHYGVKGMHWGQWNAETQRKYMGGKSTVAGRAEQFSKKLYEPENKAKVQKAIQIGVNVAGGMLGAGLASAAMPVVGAAAFSTVVSAMGSTGVKTILNATNVDELIYDVVGLDGSGYIPDALGAAAARAARRKVEKEARRGDK